KTPAVHKPLQSSLDSSFQPSSPETAPIPAQPGPPPSRGRSKSAAREAPQSPRNCAPRQAIATSPPLERPMRKNTYVGVTRQQVDAPTDIQSVRRITAVEGMTRGGARLEAGLLHRISRKQNHDWQITRSS